jgi:hypothetical protein
MPPLSPRFFFSIWYNADFWDYCQLVFWGKRQAVSLKGWLIIVASAVFNGRYQTYGGIYWRVLSKSIQIWPLWPVFFSKNKVFS